MEEAVRLDHEEGLEEEARRKDSRLLVPHGRRIGETASLLPLETSRKETPEIRDKGRESGLGGREVPPTTVLTLPGEPSP